MKLAEESSSNTEDEVSAIAVDPINMANTAIIPAASPTLCVARLAERRIIIREPTLEELTPKEIPLPLASEEPEGKQNKIS